MGCLGGAGRAVICDTAQEIEPEGPAAEEMAALWYYVDSLLWPAIGDDEPLLARTA